MRGKVKKLLENPVHYAGMKALIESLTYKWIHVCTYSISLLIFYNAINHGAIRLSFQLPIGVFSAPMFT